MENELAKEKPDSAALGKMMDSLKKNERDMLDTRHKAFAEYSKVLTKEQMAEMVITLPKFGHEVRRWMYQARAHRMGYGMGMREKCMQCGKECPCRMHPEGCPKGGMMQKGPGPAGPPAESEEMPNF